jgi:hypothetical protein
MGDYEKEVENNEKEIERIMRRK